MDGTCPNCAKALRPGDHYCPGCGQAVVQRETLRGFVDQFLGDYFTFDSKLVRSMVPLITRPGFLTAEYLAGRRARYIPPLRMFIFLSIICFLVLGWRLPVAEGDDLLDDVRFWDDFFASVLPKLFFLFLPLFAALVHLFHRRAAGPVASFILSTHFHAYVFLAFSLYGLVSRLLRNLDLVVVNRLLISALLVYTLYYLFTALRHVHRRSLGRQVLGFVGVLLSYLVLLTCTTVLVAWALVR